MQRTKIKAVYKITIGTHFYIGSSTYYQKRIRKHIQQLKNKKHFNSYLQNLYNKGYDLQFSILYESSNQDEDIQQKEQEYLDIYYNDENCINMCDKVGGGAISQNPREAGLKSHQTKLKNGYYDNPTPISEEGKQNMSIAAKDKISKDPQLYRERIKRGQRMRWERHNKNFILINEDGTEYGPYKLLIDPQRDNIISRKSARELYTGQKDKISGYIIKIL